MPQNVVRIAATDVGLSLGGGLVTVSDGEGSLFVTADGIAADLSGNVAIDISTYAVGQTDVEIRFHYYDANFDYWWAVDDVEIIGGVYFCGSTVDPPLFVDGFESGDMSAWTLSSP